jgi:hypothetical protein
MAVIVERLRQRRHRGVVVDERRQPQALRKHEAKIEVSEAEVGAGAHPPGCELDHRRNPDADGGRARAAQRVDPGDDLLYQSLGAGDVGGPDERVAQPGILQRRNSHLRAAHVDADQLAIEHRPQSTFPPPADESGGRPRQVAAITGLRRALSPGAGGVPREPFQHLAGLKRRHSVAVLVREGFVETQRPLLV